MTTHTVTILDYGMCNLLNVARAFNYVGAEVRVRRRCSNSTRI